MIVLFLEVDAFAGTILAFAYIVIDRIVIDLGFGIVIEGIISTNGGLVLGAVLVAVIDVFLFVSDLDVTLSPPSVLVFSFSTMTGLSFSSSFAGVFSSFP